MQHIHSTNPDWSGDRGYTLIEVLVALFLVLIGVLSLVSIQPQAWRLAGKSDAVGRAGEILNAELDRNEAFIMNSCNVVALGTTNKTVYGTTNATHGAGDYGYSVRTTIANAGVEVYQVTVVVTNPSVPNGIQDSIVVTRQLYFKQGC